MQETYTIWNILLKNGNLSIKRLMSRYGKVRNITWSTNKYNKIAVVDLILKNQRYKNQPLALIIFWFLLLGSWFFWFDSY